MVKKKGKKKVTFRLNSSNYQAMKVKYVMKIKYEVMVFTLETQSSKILYSDSIIILVNFSEVNIRILSPEMNGKTFHTKHSQT